MIKIPNSESTVLNYTWFTQFGGKLIGIVLLNNGREERAYIGTAEGLDETADVIRIARHGAKFPIDAALELFEPKSR